MFFRDLPSFEDFNLFNNLDHYRPLPSDWSVILTDVSGSTAAIAQGRYRDINLVGAAAIAVAQDILGHREFPFCFGGDGATILLPSSIVPTALNALKGLQQHVRQSLNLNLRVGAVSCRTIQERGSTILVAKFKIGDGNFLAMMRGGGVKIAEEIIKSDKSQLDEPTDVIDFNIKSLDALSCRWAPISSQRGCVASIIISARNERDQYHIIDQIMSKIGKIINATEARPVATDNLEHNNFFKTLLKEWRIREKLSFNEKIWKIVIPLIYMRVATLFPVFAGAKNFLQYKDDIALRSDYRKMEDALKFVLDCSIEEKNEIEKILTEFFNAGHIFYGLHTSSEAIMTCIMQDYSQKGHVHFIDGGDGGYAMAAKNLKEQIIKQKV